jgi:hypothetical protein
MANTKGEKELKTDWPVTDGLIAGTTSQTGHKERLIPTKGTLVPGRYRKGLE